MPQYSNAFPIVRNRAAFDLDVDAARISCSKSSSACKRSANVIKDGRAARLTARRPGASALRPGRAGLLGGNRNARDHGDPARPDVVLLAVVDDAVDAAPFLPQVSCFPLSLPSVCGRVRNCGGPQQPSPRRAREAPAPLRPTGGWRTAGRLSRMQAKMASEPSVGCADARRSGRRRAALCGLSPTRMHRRGEPQRA